MGFLGKFLPLLGCVALAAADNNSCPPQKIGSFCTCYDEYFREALETKVVCRDIKDVSTLLSEIQNFRGYKIDVLFLINLELPYLPAGLFLGTSVKRLYIQDSVLDNLYSTTDYKPSPFAGLEDSLEVFALRSTKNPSKWYFPDMKGFKHLKKIDIVDSPMNFVGHIFAEIGDGSLESLTVAFSRVYRIHPQAFPELLNLKEVIFRGNFLPYMVRTMFPDPAPHLKRIDLSENNLFTLPENMFDNMPALEFVDLSRNEFKTFQNMPVYNSLKSFYISNNPFECGCHLLPLKHLLVSDIKNSDLERVTCVEPGSYRKTSLKDLSTELQCY